MGVNIRLVKMICEICGIKTQINWGDGETVLCKQCSDSDQGKEIRERRRNSIPKTSAARVKVLPVKKTATTSYSFLFKTLKRIRGLFFKTFIALFIVAQVFGFLFGLFGQTKSGVLLNPYSATSIFLTLISLCAYSMTVVPLLISTHRFILLGERSDSKYFEKFKADNALPFASYILALTICYYIVITMVTIASRITNQSSTSVVMQYGVLAGSLTAIILAAGILLRCAFIYPALATGKDTNFSVSCSQTKGHLIEMFLVMFYVSLPFLITQFLLGLIPFTSLQPLWWWITVSFFDVFRIFLYALQTTLVAVALSCLYETCSEEASARPT